MPITTILSVSSGGREIATPSYAAPATLAEGIEMDGEPKVFKLYAGFRKIRFMDATRNLIVKGGLPKPLVAALRKADEATLKAIAEKLGVELDL